MPGREQGWVLLEKPTARPAGTQELRPSTGILVIPPSVPTQGPMANSWQNSMASGTGAGGGGGGGGSGATRHDPAKYSVPKMLQPNISQRLTSVAITSGVLSM